MLSGNDVLANEPGRARGGAAACDAAIVLCCMAAAFGLRTWPQAVHVFAGEGVCFQEADPWYHVRRVEHLVHHFPRVIEHDPYALAPDGQRVMIAPLLDWIAAGAALLLGGGAPPMALVHRVCACLPPILGVLLVPCVYGIARGLFGRWAAALAAAIIATLPGPILGRTSLGYFDHHVLEALLSATTMLALMTALRGAGRTRNAPVPDGEAAPASLAAISLCSLIGGVALGLYLLSWVGGSLLVFVIFAALAAQLVLDHLRGRRSAVWLLPAVGLPCLLAASAMVAPLRRLPGFDVHLTAVEAAAGLCALAALSAGLRRTGAHPLWILPGSVALSVLVVAALFLLRPTMGARIVALLAAGMGQAASTVSEATPLPLQRPGELLRGLWALFTMNGVLAAVVLVALWVRVIQRGRADHTLLVAWCTVMLLAFVLQRRFAYYAAVNVALLSAAGAAWIAGRIGARTGDGGGVSARASRAWRAAVGIAVLALTVAPNLPYALLTASRFSGPSRDWLAALDWLRENTPEPFGDAAYYVADYSRPARREPAASVMCWWDDGYWIIQRGRRVPAANPTQAGAATAARFLTAIDEAAAAGMMRQIRATHVIIDHTLPLWPSEDGCSVVGKFLHVPFWAGQEQSKYVEQMWLRAEDGTLEQVPVYHPAYYQTICARLYVFGCEAFVPDDSSWLILVEGVSGDGRGERRTIRSRRRFATYEAAVEYAAAHVHEAWELVGLSPFRSCVPLERLERFSRVYQSPTVAGRRGEHTTRQVEVYCLLDSNEQTGSAGAAEWTAPIWQ